MEGWKLCQWMFVRVNMSPRSPRNRKTKNTKKWATDIVRLTQLQKPPKNKKKSTHERVWGEAGQVTWGETFCFFCFSMVLGQFLPLSEFGLFVWEFVIDPSFRNGSRSADRMILSRHCKTCAFLQCARLHPPWSSLLPNKLYLYVLIRHIDLWTYGQIGQYFTSYPL